jgi:phosphoglycolate phosphatase
LPRPSSPLALLIFDLDGTLIDSRDDLVLSVNLALGDLRRPPLPEAVVANYVGDGAAVLMQRALGLLPPPGRTRLAPAPPLEGADAELATRGLALFLEHYAEHKLDRTVLYPGVAEGLDALRAAGFRLAVLTNKPVIPSRAILAGLGVDDRFLAIYGGNSFARKKPDPVGIHTLLRESGVEPRRAAMIGDSAVDVLTGRAAGAWTWGVTYGFAPATLELEPPDGIAASFPELCAQLLPLTDAAPLPARPQTITTEA